MKHLWETNNKLGYSIVVYSLRWNDSFGDTGLQHSPIIGWAYGGNPIYGAYGYSDSTDQNSPVRILNSGYVLDTSSIVDDQLDLVMDFCWGL